MMQRSTSVLVVVAFVAGGLADAARSVEVGATEPSTNRSDFSALDDPRALHVGPGCERILTGLAQVVLITSTSSIGYDTSNRRSKTLWSQDTLGSTTLWLYHENAWERKHGRDGLSPTSLRQMGVVSCATDVFEAEPWLWSALEAGGTLDAYYGYAGDMEPCDQPLRIKSGKLLVRKLAAMRNAVTALAAHGTVVVWIDTDVVPLRPPDAPFLAFARQHDVSYTPFTTNAQWGVVPAVNFAEQE